MNPPAQPHSPTSLAAASQIEPCAKTLRDQVRDYIRSRIMGATDEDICNALDLNPSTARPRRIELVRAGLVKDSGSVARTSSGRSAVLWIATF